MVCEQSLTMSQNNVRLCRNMRMYTKVRERVCVCSCKRIATVHASERLVYYFVSSIIDNRDISVLYYLCMVPCTEFA